jgi:hypothetical protein
MDGTPIIAVSDPEIIKEIVNGKDLFPKFPEFTDLIRDIGLGEGLVVSSVRSFYF